jgi:hypothetical protein
LGSTLLTSGTQLLGFCGWLVKPGLQVQEVPDWVALLGQVCAVTLKEPL